ncbi:snapalysin family zinc-dependent metalloprotease [Actinokineospora bangkokensis]|uniref:Extracellular small neutral protease n=1 Tax=Actinokineospora bangkokensis TaxID=1193682 RepID=A0A1Q9LIX3_9PSEU|nr:snapalysin family zinc-dependent metalloprotease [Actinokineospora bangkokensis]OLR91976.1 peptidase [Actinokineospora bangkokensis]
MSRKSLVSGAVGLALVLAPLGAGQAAAAPVAPPAAEAVTTVYYDASGAPSFASQIRQGAQNWNSSVSNVQLVEDSSRATLTYTEGNDPSGSYAQTDGHGSGTIFIDYTQAEQYNTVRITAHETGHALGLPDHYSGPCSELMSGGGPGTSCTNAYPNSAEVAEVDDLWAYGFRAAGPQVRIYDHAG